MHFRGATLVYVFVVFYISQMALRNPCLRFAIRVLLLRKQRETKNITISRMKKAQYVYL